jgi:16S rRNA (adenine1518-N6/adenine1519-N6)-dimethyltransferase
MPAHLGQHFLASDGHRRRIVDALRLKGGENILEIGPGKGAITDLLAERAGRLVAIEIDPRLADVLKARYAGNERVEIVEGDILKVALPAFAGPARVIGNLPYYITSPILMRLFENAGQFEQIVLMVQREVAERLTAKPGTRDYGLLTVTARYYSEPKLLFTIPPGAFHPRPRVESAVVGMKVVQRQFADETAFFRMVRAAFAHKRKTLVNNLKQMYGVETVKARLGKAGLGASARAEELPLDEFEKLFLLLSGG